MSDAASGIKEIALQLSSTASNNVSPLFRKRLNEPLPSRAQVYEAMELLRSALFPGYFGGEELPPEAVPMHVGLCVEKGHKILEEQIRRAFCFFCNEDRECSDCISRAHDIAHDFIAELPRVQQLLAGDVQAAYEGDPAAIHQAETVLCYPAIRAITHQRVAHELYVRHVPLIPRIITELAHARIDIHPGARIGERFFIDHGTGVVIGETCVIGDNVKIYQGVTLGAKSFPLDERGLPIKGIKRHPNVENGVTIYAGATILGDITIGRGAVIGGNMWITESVPPGAKVTQRCAESCK